MTKPSSWGSALQAYRKNLRLTQGQFIQELSLLISELSAAEKTLLIDAQIYEEAASYFGGILDSPTLSRLEKGTRTLTHRPRSVALVWGLKRLAALDTVEEANQFLELGGQGNLTAAESAAIFETALSIDHSADQLTQPQAESLAKQNDEPLDSEAFDRGKRTTNLRAIMGAVGLLGVAIILGATLYIRSTLGRGTMENGTAQVVQVETNTTDALVADERDESTSQTITSIMRHALLADRLIPESGTIGNGQTLYNLHELDLKGRAEIWHNFVKFLPENEEPYIGFRAYSVPQHIPRAAVSMMRVEANYRGSAFEEQAWVWSIFNLKEPGWERLGDNRDGPWWGDWTLFTFNVTGDFVDYVNDEDEILLKVQSNNGSDGMDLDYEAIIIEWSQEP